MVFKAEFTTGQNILTASQSIDKEAISVEACCFPCFQMMQLLYSQHVEIVHLYYLLFALLFDNQKLKEIPTNASVSSYQFF